MFSSSQTSPPRELIHLHCGQCGIQVGAALWNAYCYEHHIHPRQRAAEPVHLSNVLFSEAQGGSWTARAAFLDLGDDLCFEHSIRRSSISRVFSPDCAIIRKDGCGGVSGCASYSGRYPSLKRMKERLRILTENCCHLAGFIITHSICGGTGSGCMQWILELLRTEYGAVPVVTLSVFPSPTSGFGSLGSSVVEPYNSVLGFQAIAGLQSRYSADMVVVFDNEKLYEVCESKLGVKNPGFGNVNQLIAQVAAGFTAPLRGGAIPCSLETICDDLVPGICRLVCPSLHPLRSKVLSDQQEEVRTTKFFLRAMSSSLCSCSPMDGKLASATVFYRDGRLISTIPFSRFAECHLNSGEKNFLVSASHCVLCPFGPVEVPEFDNCFGDLPFLTSLVNSSSLLSSIVERMLDRLDQIYARRPFFGYYAMEGVKGNELVNEPRWTLQNMRDEFECASGDDETGFDFDEEF